MSTPGTVENAGAQAAVEPARALGALMKTKGDAARQRGDAVFGIQARTSESQIRYDLPADSAVHGLHADTLQAAVAAGSTTRFEESSPASQQRFESASVANAASFQLSQMNKESGVKELG